MDNAGGGVMTITKTALKAEARRQIREAVPFRAQRAHLDVHVGDEGFHVAGVHAPWGGDSITWPEALALLYPGAVLEVCTYERISRIGEEADWSLFDIVTVRLPGG